jgi:signal transduction histidine kinase
MKLGTKLIIWLVSMVVVTMLSHGYLSIQQDRENIVREMRVGMSGLSRSIQAALQHIYGDEKDFKATQNLIDAVGRPGNIHGLVVYDPTAKPMVISGSLTASQTIPILDPAPVLNIDPRPVLQSGVMMEGYVEHPAHPVYYRIEPIFNGDNHLVGAFVLGRRGVGSRETLEARRARILTTTLVLIGLLSLSILFLVRRNVSRPIAQLIEHIRAVGVGPWDKRVEVQGRDEISLLAQEFNQMCDRLQELYGRLAKEQQDRLALERNLRQSEKLASVGQLAAGLAHEIGTPLNIIGGRAEFLLRRPRGPEETADNLQIIRAQIDRIAGIVRQLLAFSRRAEPLFRPVDLAGLLQNVRRLLEHRLEEKRVRVEVAAADRLPTIAADPDQLQQVFFNLFLNSLHALSPGGLIRIRAGVASDGASSPAPRTPDTIWIEFEDNGPGIAPEHLGQVFDPFFTTKDIGEGTGLGLSVSYGIIKDHGGEIRVDSRPGEWTRFVITLPIRGDIAEPANLAAP